MIGRAMDQFRDVRVESVVRKQGIKPFTAEWLEYDEAQEKRGVRYR